MKAPIARMVVKGARGGGRREKLVQPKPLPPRRVPAPAPSNQQSVLSP